MGLCCAICDDAVLGFPAVALHNPADQATEGVAVLPCGHFYGAACVSGWLATQNRARRAPTCPDCRHPLVHRACGHAVRLLSSPFTPLRPRGAAEGAGAVMLSLPTHLPPALLRMMDKKDNNNSNNSNNGNGNQNKGGGQVEEDEYCSSCRSKQALARRAAMLRDRIRMAAARASRRRVGVNDNSNNSSSNNNNNQQNSIANRRRVVPAQPNSIIRTPASREQQQALQRALGNRVHMYPQTSTQQRRLLAHLVHRYLTEPANSARFLELIG